MFLHIFHYQLRALFRKKWCLCWNLFFPIVLASAFFLGFGRFIKNPDVLMSVKTAIVKTSDDDVSDSFVSMVKKLDFIHVKVVSDRKARQLLKDKKIDGILYAPSMQTESGEPSLTIRENGINQTILAQFLKSYIANAKEMSEIYSSTPDPKSLEKAARLLKKDMSFGSSDVDIRYSDDDRKQMSPYMHYFFALISMASLFASWISTSILDEILPNHSEIGKRYASAPVPKTLSLTASILSGFLTELICIICLIFYIQYVLGLDFNAPLFYVTLISAVCSMTGISFGVMFGALLGNHPSASVAVPLIFSMICSFFSGLMVGNMQQIIQVTAPIINRINPAALLTDGLDSLCNYGISSVYWNDLLMLLILSAVSIMISSIVLRRKNYASL